MAKRRRRIERESAEVVVLEFERKPIFSECLLFISEKMENWGSKSVGFTDTERCKL